MAIKKVYNGKSFKFIKIQLFLMLVHETFEIETHRRPTVDHPLGGKRRFRLRFIEEERLGTDLERFLHDERRRETWIWAWERGISDASKCIANQSCYNLLTRC